MKIIKISLFIIILAFLSAQKTFAITKTSGDLEVAFEEPLFSSNTTWYPGFSLSKSITVKNNAAQNYTTGLEALNKSETNNLSSVLNFKVTENSIVRYGPDKTLKNFWDDEEINLSSIAPHQQITYDITVEMNPVAGNEYQGKQAKFDLKVGFLGEEGKVAGEVISTASFLTKEIPKNIIKPWLIFFTTLFSLGSLIIIVRKFFIPRD